MFRNDRITRRKSYTVSEKILNPKTGSDAKPNETNHVEYSSNQKDFQTFYNPIIRQNMQYAM